MTCICSTHEWAEPVEDSKAAAAAKEIEKRMFVDVFKLPDMEVVWFLWWMSLTSCELGQQKSNK
jgi:hypothetical protein